MSITTTAVDAHQFGQDAAYSRALDQFRRALLDHLL